MRYLRTKHPFGGFLNHDRTPILLFKTEHVPAFLLTAGVIIFSAIDAIEQYGTETVLPVLSGNNRFTGSVFIVHHHPETKRGSAETDLQFTIAAALHIVKSISQQDSDSVTAFLHLRGDIISIIIDTFVIVAPKGGKFAVSHFFSIQRKFIKAQATYIRCGVFHFLCHMELATQINTFLCQSIHSSPGGLCLRLFQFTAMIFPAFGYAGILTGNGPNPFTAGESCFGSQDTEIRRRTPCRRRISLIPDTDTPSIMPVLLQGRIRTGNQLALSGFYFAAVPDYFSCPYIPNLYLISSLPRAIFRRTHLPSQTRGIRDSHSSFAHLTRQAGNSYVFRLHGERHN